MEIYRTFDEQTSGVYLARFVNCPFYETPDSYENELSKSLDLLLDPLEVRTLIKNPNSGWKKGIYKNKTLYELTNNVLEELDDLMQDIKYLQNESQDESLDWLLDNFKPLSNADLLNKPERLKMYTYEYGSLLRLYGVQLGQNSVIITGIALKLADKMQDGNMTKLELDKMNYLRSWLLENNITHSEELTQ